MSATVAPRGLGVGLQDPIKSWPNECTFWVTVISKFLDLNPTLIWPYQGPETKLESQNRILADQIEAEKFSECFNAVCAHYDFNLSIALFIFHQIYQQSDKSKTCCS